MINRMTTSEIQRIYRIKQLIYIWNEMSTTNKLIFMKEHNLQDREAEKYLIDQNLELTKNDFKDEIKQYKWYKVYPLNIISDKELDNFINRLLKSKNEWDISIVKNYLKDDTLIKAKDINVKTKIMMYESCQPDV